MSDVQGRACFSGPTTSWRHDGDEQWILGVPAESAMSVCGLGIQRQLLLLALVRIHAHAGRRAQVLSLRNRHVDSQPRGLQGHHTSYPCFDHRLIHAAWTMHVLTGCLVASPALQTLHCNRSVPQDGMDSIASKTAKSQFSRLHNFVGVKAGGFGGLPALRAPLMSLAGLSPTAQILNPGGRLLRPWEFCSCASSFASAMAYVRGWGLPAGTAARF